MFVLNITDEYGSFIICADNKNENINIILKYLHPSIPANIIILSERFSNVHNDWTFTD